jgi:2-polyprenyl-3-methyl-5-hydroxy-6-metoxy-1,4-benzoquinol methylase
MIPSHALSIQNASQVPVTYLDTIYNVWCHTNVDKLVDDFANEIQENEIEAERCPFGGVLWPSSRIFIEWFAQHPLFENAKNLNVCELGCGVGALSCLLQSFGFHVTATDYEPSFKEFIAQNSLEFRCKTPPQFEVLNWQEPVPQNFQNAFDIVIGCDVLYDATHIQSIPKILRGLLNKSGTAFIADPGRHRFSTALENLKLEFQEIKIHSQRTIQLTTFEKQFGTVSKGIELSEIKILEIL